VQLQVPAATPVCAVVAQAPRPEQGSVSEAVSSPFRTNSCSTVR
jgi:hypothetical protein